MSNELNLTLLTFPTVPDIISRRLTTRTLCEIAQKNGLTGLDMMQNEVKLHCVKKLKCELSVHSLKLHSLIAHVPMSEFNSKIVTKKCDAAIKTANFLDCKEIMIVPMGQFEAQRLKPRDKRKVFESYVCGFSLAARLCKLGGVNLSFEDTPTCLLPLSGTRECLNLLEAVPELGLVYDSANMLPFGSNPLEFYEATKSRITYAHLKDVEYVEKGQDLCANGKYIKCCEFGKGVVDVKTVAKKIAAENNITMAIEYTKPEKHNKTAHFEHLKAFVDYLTD